jgi:hypothetical protein
LTESRWRRGSYCDGGGIWGTGDDHAFVEGVWGVGYDWFEGECVVCDIEGQGFMHFGLRLNFPSLFLLLVVERKIDESAEI